jgi:phosphoribosylanthranilate isomerase
VFVKEAPADIVHMMKIAGVDVAQVYLGELPPGVRTWRARNVDDTFTVSELDDPTPEAFLLDAAAPVGVHGGTGKVFDWTRVPSVNRKIVLAGGLNASNVATALAVAKPWGVDACSQLESSPGRKDHRRVREFVEAALSVHV